MLVACRVKILFNLCLVATGEGEEEKEKSLLFNLGKKEDIYTLMSYKQSG